MKNPNNKSNYYWLLPLQASPGVLLLMLVQPLPFLDSYSKTLAALQILISCATIPVIQSFNHNSFRIWLCGSLVVPFPILLFMERLYFEPNLLSAYYLYLTLFFIINYQLRNLSIFVPLLLASFFGSIFIWGILEVHSNIENEYFFYMSPILNFFLIVGDKLSVSIFYLIIISFFGYIVFFIKKYLLKATV